MKVDAVATKAARKRHEAGVARLRDLFGGESLIRYLGRNHISDTRAVRLHPNTPPVRDAEHQRKHRLRKLARASRKRNRRSR